MCRITVLDYIISNAPAYFYDSMILLLNTGHLRGSTQCKI